MFKRCALAQVVPFLVMVLLGLVLALIGPHVIRQRDASQSLGLVLPAK